MSDLNDFIYTNKVHDVLAEYVNRLLASTMRSEYKNVETLVADRQLTDADTPIQRLDCGGVDRNVFAPEPDAVENHALLLVNTSDGGEVITLRDYDDTITIGTIDAGKALLLLPDGDGGYVSAGGGGGGGGLESVVAGAGIVVDTTDSANPEISTRSAITVLVQGGTISTGDGKVYIGPLPSSVNGKNLVSAVASVLTKSTSGTPTIQIARGRQANATSAHSFSDMLSTRITIDANDFSSLDASAPPVIDGATDDIATGDFIRVDVDVPGTGTANLYISLEFELP
jgi:hypothetical protein